MGLADSFSREDRVEVKFSDFYSLVKGCTQRDMMQNAVNTDVPHEFIRSMVSGKKDSEREEQ